MWLKLKELYSLLSSEQRRKLLLLQVLVVITSFAEIAGVVSIGPFMAIVGDMQQLQGEGLLADIYRASGLSSPEDFLFWLGVAVLSLLAMAAFISMYTIWRLSIYGVRVGAELSSRLFKYYMHQPWLFHTGTSSSQLTKQIAQECQRVTEGLINPIMQMNAKLVMSSLMTIAVLIYSPGVALMGIAIFVIAYVILYKAVRHKLVANGRAISQTQSQRFKLMAEGFGGIKDTLLLGRQKVFVHRFEKTSCRFATAKGTTQALGQVPRYAMELLAFSAVIFLVLYLLKTHNGNLGEILPILSVYALAGFKILPAFQQIYTSISQIRGNLAAFEAIRNDLVASSDKVYGNNFASGLPSLSLRHDIIFKDVVFRYPGKEEPAIRELNLCISVHQVVGLVGASGSGKSTAIDLLLGLIEPDRGSILIDGQPLKQSNKRSWQDTIGFVSQSIFLSDASIRENIAFGLPRQEISESKIQQAVSMAHLNELLAELPNGLDTFVGERGVQLSGGQRQRIGIARALYHDADVLVLDEATSALDGITERMIMDAIHDFSGKKTIIMIAHRLATVKKCRLIYLMEHGKVIDQGSYQELFQRNDIFKRMAEHA